MANVVATREIVEIGNTLRAEVRNDGRVTLSVHPHATSATVSAVYLRELAQQAEVAIEPEDTFHPASHSGTSSRDLDREGRCAYINCNHPSHTVVAQDLKPLRPRADDTTETNETKGT